MRIQLGGGYFRITIEWWWPGREAILRRHRISSRDGAMRRKLLQAVERRLTA
ncbi:MAG: hypothetical protein ACXW3Z_03165 [Limisphaerales bacterium]